MHVLCHTQDTSALMTQLLHCQRQVLHRLLLLRCWQQQPPQAKRRLLPLLPH